MLVVPPSLAVEAERSGVPFQVGCQPSQAYIDGLWTRVRARGPGADGGLIARELFAGAATRGMLDAVRHARDDWKPDLVIREPCE